MHMITLAVCCVALYCHRDTFVQANNIEYYRFQVQIVTKRLELTVRMKILHRIRLAFYRSLCIVYYFSDRLVSIEGSVMNSMNILAKYSK